MKVKPSSKRGRVLVELDPDDRLMAGAETGKGNAAAAFQLKRILVPVDFSDCALKALEYALPFARQFGASILLVHVVQLHYGGALYGPVDFPDLEKDFQVDSESRLTALKQQTAEAEEEVTVETRSLSGRPATEIARIAAEEDVDLIVLSTHGYTGLKHMFMGSTAEQVVRHAPCPVLVVRQKEHEFVAPERAGGHT